MEPAQVNPASSRTAVGAGEPTATPDCQQDDCDGGELPWIEADIGCVVVDRPSWVGPLGRDPYAVSNTLSGGGAVLRWCSGVENESLCPSAAVWNGTVLAADSAADAEDKLLCWSAAGPQPGGCGGRKERVGALRPYVPDSAGGCGRSCPSAEPACRCAGVTMEKGADAAHKLLWWSAAELQPDGCSD